MARVVLFIIAVVYAITAIWMAANPAQFYASIPSVQITGPYNMHFIIDVAIVYGVSAVLLALGAHRRRPGFARAGAAWPAAHGVFHIIMIFVMPITDPTLLAWEFGGVIGPAALAAWAAMALRPR